MQTSVMERPGFKHMLLNLIHDTKFLQGDILLIMRFRSFTLM